MPPESSRLNAIKTSEDGTFLAKSVSGVVCEHGAVHIRLHDENGAIFADACMQDEIFLMLSEQVLRGLADHLHDQRGSKCGAHQ